jgi:hypothetical protein
MCRGRVTHARSLQFRLPHQDEIEIEMKEETHTTDQTTPSTADVVAEAVVEATARVASVAAQVSDGTIAFRALVRGQPIAMALLMVWIGYALGRVCGGNNGPAHRDKQ